MLPQYRFSFLFQSTHPSGVRLTVKGTATYVNPFQSTHPSGVRQIDVYAFLPRLNFNPRTPVGCDDNAIINPIQPTVFQSTHPSGVRRAAPKFRPTRRYHFNPRTPVGCDVACTVWPTVTFDFNPRTPVGCDHVPTQIRRKLCISIHAPQWGATASGDSRPCPMADFNPRTPVGCDVMTHHVSRR